MARVYVVKIIAALLSLPFFVSTDSVSYDINSYSAKDAAPFQTYQSNAAVKPPEVLVTSYKAGSLAPGYFFIGVDGAPSSKQNAPCILDMSEQRMGSLIWTGINYTEPFDFRMQTYNGQPVLTFWSGQLLNGYGHGSYYILNQSYAEIAHFSPVGFPQSGDIHEFYITSQDTALVTIYSAQRADLSSIGGPTDGWILESLFQEIEIATNKLLFQWNATTHVSINETYNELNGTGTQDAPFDWFHINSIEKDANGDYLVSGRVMNCLYKISGKGGSVIWRLQGKKSDFKVDPQATFAFQHDARWINDTAQDRLTLFSNGPTSTLSYSRGLLLAINQNAKTATLMTEFTNKPKTFGQFEGNLQAIDPSNPSTNYALGYGSQQFFSELNSEGEVLLDVQFGMTNVVNSYRAYKSPWVGLPMTKPDIKWDKAGGMVYLSWHGATEHESWIVHNSPNKSLSAWSPVTTANRTGFETTVNVTTASVDTYVRAAAVAANGTILGWTSATDGDNTIALDDPTVNSANNTTTSPNSTTTASTTTASDTGTAAGTPKAKTAGAQRVGVHFAAIFLALVLFV